MIGFRFDRLVVISAAAPVMQPNTGKALSRWLCLCDCGAEKIIKQASLRSGNTRSCGCLQRESIALLRTTHKESDSRIHYIWRAIKQRCLNPNARDYPRYGERGIMICDRWRDNYEAFRDDMGPRPSAMHSVERIDNSGNYEPANCRWALPKEQSANKRNNFIVELHGRQMTLSEASRLTGLHRATIKNRLNTGWTMERALTAPARKLV